MPILKKDVRVSRRQALGTLGSLGALTLFGCGGSSETASSIASPVTAASGGEAATAAAVNPPAAVVASPAVSPITSATATPGSCTLIPTETEGPFPLLAILSNSAVVRKDIREAKTGIPLTLVLNLQNVNNTCAPISNAAIYIWHCDKDGEYSGYSSNANGNHQGETFLRGVQITDANGQVSFTTIFPGWYAGRITHIHFQVYLNDNLRVTATATSQLAFPDSVTTTAYNTALYSHGQNTSVKSFAADNVFNGGTTYQMATVSGDVTSGFVATLDVGIKV